MRKLPRLLQLILCFSSVVSLPSRGLSFRLKSVILNDSLSPEIIVNQRRAELLNLLSMTPRGAASPAGLTNEILSVVKSLERENPTEESQILKKLSGTWELIWTAQDYSQRERGWINPLENQAYSNNPRGRTTPVLPQSIQNALEDLGVLPSAVSDAPGLDDDTTEGQPSFVSSTQSIDLQAMQVRNVVVFGIGQDSSKKKLRRLLSLTVTVEFLPNLSDACRIDVKFRACRVVFPGTPIDFTLPLGIFGPTGWLRTVYIDDTLRVTRGHKGSVFILMRPNAT
jgi:hypothetical protein